MDNVKDLLRRLPRLDVVQLREEWFLLFYREAPTAMSSRLMRLALAHRIQVLEHEAAPRWAEIVKRAHAQPLPREENGCGADYKLRPGTRLMREYAGKVHEVLAVENGRFVYEGQVFKSLSAVAERITGKKKGGPCFFGLKSGAGTG